MIRRPRPVSVMLSSVALFALAAAGCESPRTAAHAATEASSSPRTTAPAAHEVAVIARNYAFEMPDTISAGLTAFHLMNHGTEPHHLMFYRLDEGKTMGDAFAELKTGGPLPYWMHPAGGPNAPAPGSDSRATVNLVPGHYMAFCHIPSPDHVLHLAKGMMKEVTVVPSTAVRTPMPEADLTVTLTNYEFTFSHPPVRGPQTVAIINAGADTHEMILSELKPGTTADDFVRWINNQQGPAPVTPFGGITDIAPGDTALVRVDFHPGNYSVTCRVRDAKDGRTHDLHGMSMGFTVE